jgi:hypothetical protein
LFVVLYNSPQCAAIAVQQMFMHVQSKLELTSKVYMRLCD